MICPVEYKSFNQLSVSKHSFLAIFNFESISGKLCGYCASVMFAKTLDEDLRIWKTVFEQFFILDNDWQSNSISIANCSAYFISRFSFIISPYKNHNDSCVCNPRKRYEINSVELYVIKPNKLHTLLCNDYIRLRRLHTKPSAWINNLSWKST